MFVESHIDSCQTTTLLSSRLCSVAVDMQASCDRVVGLLQQLVDIKSQKKCSLVKTLALEAPVSPTVYQAYMAPLTHMHVLPSQRIREKTHEAYTQPPLSTPATQEPAISPAWPGEAMDILCLSPTLTGAVGCVNWLFVMPSVKDAREIISISPLFVLSSEESPLGPQG